jgi:hypothetical protein
MTELMDGIAFVAAFMLAALSCALIGAALASLLAAIGRRWLGPPR